MSEREFTLSFRLRSNDSETKLGEVCKTFLAKFLEVTKGSVSVMATSKVEGISKRSFTDIAEFPLSERDHRHFFNRSITRSHDGNNTMFRIDHKVLSAEPIPDVKHKLWLYLKANGLYMTGGDLKPTEYRKVAWFFGAHPTMVNIQRTEEILNQQIAKLDPDFIKETCQRHKGFKMGDPLPRATAVPHTISWGTDRNRVQTQVLAITSMVTTAQLIKALVCALPRAQPPPTR